MQAMPGFTVAVLIFAVVASISLPILLFITFKRRLGCSVRPFFYGMATFLLFAMVLEQAVHQVVFRTSHGAAIMQSSWLFALYGGLMAAIFEESGRLIVFKTALRKHMANDRDALMFGAGHGSAEVIIVFTISMIGNLVYALPLFFGKGPTMLAGLEGERLAATQAIFAALSTTRPTLFLVGLVERLIAVVLHLSFSALVWTAVKGGKRRFFCLALSLHAGVDMMAVLLSRNALPILLIEAVVALFALASALLARRAYRGLGPAASAGTSDAGPG